jgi:hypothetical protein
MYEIHRGNGMNNKNKIWIIHEFISVVQYTATANKYFEVLYRQRRMVVIIIFVGTSRKEEPKILKSGLPHPHVSTNGSQFPPVRHFKLECFK